jgi:thioredoxin-like negative regulator of GroEL
MPAHKLCAQADYWIAHGDRYQAVACLHEALEKEPTNYRLHHRLIYLLIKMNKLSQAIALFDGLPLRAQVSRGLGIAISYVFFAKSLLQSQNLLFSTQSQSQGESAANMDRLIISQYFLADQFEQAFQGLFRMMDEYPEYDQGWAQRGLVNCLEYMEESHPGLVEGYKQKLSGKLHT